MSPEHFDPEEAERLVAEAYAFAWASSCPTRTLVAGGRRARPLAAPCNPEERTRRWSRVCRKWCKGRVSTPPGP